MLRIEGKGREMRVSGLAVVLTVCLILAVCSSAYAFPRGVSAGGSHTVGLKSNGTVVGVGYNYWGQLNVGSWSNIVQVAAGHQHTVGLRSNGTVVGVGDNSGDQVNVGSWTNIVQVAAGANHTVGLKTDGTVVAVGNSESYPNVSSWSNIVQVAAGCVSHGGIESRRHGGGRGK